LLAQNSFSQSRAALLLPIAISLTSYRDRYPIGSHAWIPRGQCAHNQATRKRESSHLRTTEAYAPSRSWDARLRRIHGNAGSTTPVWLRNQRPTPGRKNARQPGSGPWVIRGLFPFGKKPVFTVPRNSLCWYVSSWNHGTGIGADAHATLRWMLASRHGQRRKTAR